MTTGVAYQLERALDQLGPIVSSLEAGPNPSGANPAIPATSLQVARLQDYYFQIWDWLMEPQQFSLLDSHNLPGILLVPPPLAASAIYWQESNDIENCLDLSAADSGVYKEFFLTREPCAGWLAQVQSTLGNAALLLTELGYGPASEVVDSAQSSIQGQAERAAGNLAFEVPLWLKISLAAGAGILLYNWSK
jgi:hypothetical protein